MNPHQKELRIILVGKVGTGKTSSGNIILSRTQPFKKPTSSLGLTTKKCRMKSETIGDTKVIVVDTPGLCSTGTGSLSEEETVNQLKKSITWTDPGPHVFLLVMTYGEVFTEEEEETLEILQRTFGKRFLDYTMILFTHTEDVDENSIRDFINLDINIDLKQLIDDNNLQYHLLNIGDNCDPKDPPLLNRIPGGRFYDTRMLKEAVKQQRKEEDRKTLKRSGIVGSAVGAVIGQIISEGGVTSKIAALLGAVVGGILAIIIVCLGMCIRNRVN